MTELFGIHFIICKHNGIFVLLLCVIRTIRLDGVGYQKCNTRPSHTIRQNLFKMQLIINEQTKNILKRKSEQCVCTFIKFFINLLVLHKKKKIGTQLFLTYRIMSFS